MNKRNTDSFSSFFSFWCLYVMGGSVRLVNDPNFQGLLECDNHRAVKICAMSVYI